MSDHEIAATYCHYMICVEKWTGPHEHESKGGWIKKHAPGRCDRGVHPELEARTPDAPSAESDALVRFKEAIADEMAHKPDPSDPFEAGALAAYNHVLALLAQPEKED